MQIVREIPMMPRMRPAFPSFEASLRADLTPKMMARIPQGIEMYQKKSPRIETIPRMRAATCIAE